MDAEKLVAATLAAGLINSNPKVVMFAADVTPAKFAAMVYLDCLEAIHAEQERRRQVQLENSGRQPQGARFRRPCPASLGRPAPGL